MFFEPHKTWMWPPTLSDFIRPHPECRVTGWDRVGEKREVVLLSLYAERILKGKGKSVRIVFKKLYFCKCQSLLKGYPTPT